MGLRSLLKRKKKHVLFNGNDSLFKTILSSVSHYGEYGCGASTLWAAGNSSCQIISVDTSIKWRDSVLNQISLVDRDRVTIKYYDCGQVENWGRPISYSNRKNFQDYVNALWSDSSGPEFILVDGRFRVACFLTSLIFAREGSFILFDDFWDRSKYALVLEYIQPIESCGTQALFQVPVKSSMPLAAISEDIERFLYVID